MHYVTDLIDEGNLCGLVIVEGGVPGTSELLSALLVGLAGGRLCLVPAG